MRAPKIILEKSNISKECLDLKAEEKSILNLSGLNWEVKKK